MTKGRLQVHIRWMIRRDKDEVLAIENASFGWQGWSEEEFLRRLRLRNCIAMICERGEKVIGFMVYELEKHALRVTDMAVDPVFRRRGIGIQIIQKLKNKLSSHRRQRILLTLRESNLDAQLFLRSQGFQAVKIDRESFGDDGEDGIVFAYRYPGAVAVEEADAQSS